MTRLVLRQAAERDISEATDHCFGEGGIDLAIGFAEAVDAALLHAETDRASGSPRYAVELSLQGLRSWQTGSGASTVLRSRREIRRGTSSMPGRLPTRAFETIRGVDDSDPG